MLSAGKQLTKEEAEEYNKKIAEWRLDSRSFGGGCVATRACTNCYTLITDSICLCIGCFTCPVCGHKNGTPMTKTENLQEISETTDFGSLFVKIPLENFPKKEQINMINIDKDYEDMLK